MICRAALNPLGVGYICDAVQEVGVIQAKLSGIENTVIDWFETTDVYQWYESAKNDVDILVQDIKAIHEIATFDLFSYIQQFINNVLGVSLDVAFWIAIIVVVIGIVAMFGGIVSVVNLVV